MPKDHSNHSSSQVQGDKIPDRCHRLFKETVLEAIDDGLDCVLDRGVLDDLACKMELHDADRDQIIEEVLREKGMTKPGKVEKAEEKEVVKTSAIASKASKKDRNAKEEMDEAREVIDELSRELEEAHLKEMALKARIAELEAKNLELLAQLGRAEVEPPPEGASGDGQRLIDLQGVQASASVDDEFWGPRTGLTRPKERPTTAPIDKQSVDKASRPKTLPMPPKDDDTFMMKSVECQACGAKNTIESKLKGNVEFVCKGCSKRSYVNIGGG